MKTLIKNGSVVNVFTGEIERANVLVDGKYILGVGDYYEESEADRCVDATGKYIAPGFIDGHIHIESTLLTPKELAKICVLHGTTAIVADPHEIANVSGKEGIRYMLRESEQVPMHVYMTLPSCVPATGFDESGAVLVAAALEEFYEEERVLGLGEMMNYPGVLAKDPEVMKKIQNAKDHGLVVNGHAPLLSGRELDVYIGAGIRDDHECTELEEAKERIRKGQWVMIREGSFAKNLVGLIGLFEEPFARRCLLVTDDRHPSDLLKQGHLDYMLWLAVQHGASAVKAIQMVTMQAAACFGLKNKGAVAPGYDADLVILDNLEDFSVCHVFVDGKQVVNNKTVVAEADCAKESAEETGSALLHSVRCRELSAKDFFIADKKQKCRIIQTIPHQLITTERLEEVDFDKYGDITGNQELLKIAVVERHCNTGNIGLGLIAGLGIKKGAIASTVAHDSHNLVIAGTNSADMAVAGNHLREVGGGYVAVLDGKVLACVPLPVGGLMSNLPVGEVVEQQKRLAEAWKELGVEEGGNPFTSMGFVCLPVIPSLKLTTKGLVDVINQQIVPFFADERQ